MYFSWCFKFICTVLWSRFLAGICFETILRKVWREYTLSLGLLVARHSFRYLRWITNRLLLSSVEKAEILGTDLRDLFPNWLCIKIFIESLLLLRDLIISHGSPNPIDWTLCMSMLWLHTWLSWDLWFWIDLGESRCRLRCSTDTCDWFGLYTSWSSWGTFYSLCSILDPISHHATLSSVTVLTCIENSMHSKSTRCWLNKPRLTPIELLTSVITLSNWCPLCRLEMFCANSSLLHLARPLLSILSFWLLLDHTAIKEFQISYEQILTSVLLNEMNETY